MAANGGNKTRKKNVWQVPRVCWCGIKWTNLCMVVHMPSHTPKLWWVVMVTYPPHQETIGDQLRVKRVLTTSSSPGVFGVAVVSWLVMWRRCPWCVCGGSTASGESVVVVGPSPSPPVGLYGSVVVVVVVVLVLVLLRPLVVVWLNHMVQDIWSWSLTHTST